MSISPPPSKCGISHESLDKKQQKQSELEMERLRRLAEIRLQRECERGIDPESEWQREIAEIHLKQAHERGISDPELEWQRLLAENRLRLEREREIDPVEEERLRRRRIAKTTQMGKKVLQQYNLRHKDAQYEIVQGLRCFPMSMIDGRYYHLNFLARPKNSAPDSQPQRFFAEFTFIRGRTRPKVTECTILNMDPDDPEDAPVARCACCLSMLEIFHPRNGAFIGGRRGPGSVECIPVGGAKLLRKGCTSK